MNLLHIESRSSKRHDGDYEFIVECDHATGDFDKALEDIKHISSHTNVVSREYEEDNESIPWFPLHIRDLDKFANQILSYGSELDADHPGFTDPVYRARRKEFADIAFNYRHGEPIPRVTYTEAEIETWGTIYRNLKGLFKTHACSQFNHILPLLEQNCGYSDKAIPQLQVST